MNAAHRCPEPQTLAAFVEGTLSAAGRRALLEHLDDCEECMSAIDTANEVFGDEERRQEVAPARKWWLAAAAAAVVVLGIAVTLWRTEGWRAGGPSMARLVAVAPRSAREVEARLSGGFAWAAYRGPERAGDAPADEERMRLSGVAAEAIRAARDHPSPDADQVAGVAMLLAGQPEPATALLENATVRSPQKAKAWSDLAAAEDAAAVQRGEASRYPTALAAADRALRLQPRLAEALFNRALILEHMRLSSQARRAWEQYLDVDATSPWAAEARARAAALPATQGTQRFDRERPLLERAAAAGDGNEVHRICAAYSERCRAFGEAVYLGAWGEAVEKGDPREAARNLTIARAIGDALAQTSGESLLRDAVSAIDDAGDRTVSLAAAHRQYTRGRIVYAQQRPAEAEPLLREAAAGFGGTPMSLVARYYAANARFDQAGTAEARAQLGALLREAPAHPRWTALEAQVQWELALCNTAAGDWSEALPLLEHAAAAFTRLGERSNLAFIDTLLADVLASAGRLDDSAAARLRSFALASSEQHDDRLAIGLASAATLELRTGRRDEARALLGLAATAAAEARNDTLLVDMLMQSALLDAADGDSEGAMRHAETARQAASRIADAPLRERATAYADVANAAATLSSNPAAAGRLATAAIDFFTAHDVAVHLPLCYLLRARSALRAGERAAAAADLDLAIAAVDAHPIALGNDITTAGVLDAAPAIFDEAIGLALDRGDAAAAFGYAERKNRRQARGVATAEVTLETLRARLTGSGTSVLALTVLPQRVVAFAISARGAFTTERAATREEVTALADRARSLSDETALRALYELLIGSSESRLRAEPRAIIVADPLLQGVPFGALIDSASQPLIAHVSVGVAATAASLTKTSAPALRSVALVALPSGVASATTALPETDRELADIAAAYGTSAITRAGATIASISRAALTADVLHIAGHTARLRGNDDVALMLDDGQTASWRAITAIPLRNQTVVVLAACETLRAPRSRQSRGLSLGNAFLAAGAAEVIGTLAPIADRDAAALFADVHRQLAGGSSGMDAVRHAQLLASHERGTAWRALSVLTTRID